MDTANQISTSYKAERVRSRHLRSSLAKPMIAKRLLILLLGKSCGQALQSSLGCRLGDEAARKTFGALNVVSSRS